MMRNRIPQRLYTAARPWRGRVRRAARPGRGGQRRGPIVVCAMLWAILIAGTYAPALAITVEQVLDALPFSAADKQRIENGELVSTDVPDPSERELGALLGFVFKRPVDATVELFRKGSA